MNVMPSDCRRLRFSSDADIVRLTNARIIIIIIINVLRVLECKLEDVDATA